MYTCNIVIKDTDKFGGVPVVLDAVNDGERELSLC